MEDDELCLPTNCPKGQGQADSSSVHSGPCGPYTCPKRTSGVHHPTPGDLSDDAAGVLYGMPAGWTPKSSRQQLGYRSSQTRSVPSHDSGVQVCTENVCIGKIADKMRGKVSEPKTPSRRVRPYTGGGDISKPVITFSPCPPKPSGAKGSAGYIVCKPQDFDEDEDEEETPAEVAAAMLHSEERGIMMRSEPARIYNTLFHDPDELMLVTTASPNPMQDVVVPVADEMLPLTASRENLTLSASIIADDSGMPSTSLFTDKIKEMGLYDEVTEPDCFADAEEDDVEIMIDSTSFSSVHEGIPPESLEVLLDTALPAHFSRVQLRGSVPPDWFPGYFEALPALPDMTDVNDCPVSVMEEAWESVLQS